MSADGTERQTASRGVRSGLPSPHRQKTQQRMLLQLLLPPHRLSFVVAFVSHGKSNNSSVRSPKAKKQSNSSRRTTKQMLQRSPRGGYCLTLPAIAVGPSAPIFRKSGGAFLHRRSQKYSDIQLRVGFLDKNASSIMQRAVSRSCLTKILFI